MEGAAPLPASWEWAPSPSGAASSPWAGAEFVGVEATRGSLRPAGLPHFAHVIFQWLPQRGLGAALLAHNIARVLAGSDPLGTRQGTPQRPFEQILLDWPEIFGHHLELVLDAHPAGLVFAPQHYVRMGALAGLPGEEDLADVWIVEALTPRRVFVRGLRERYPGLRVRCMGGADGNVTALVSGDLAVADAGLPTESLLPYGLLPYLEARLGVFARSLPFAPGLASRSRDAARAMASAVLEAEAKGTRTLVVGDELTFVHLPAELAALTAGNLTSLHDKRRRDRDARFLQPARPLPEHHAQYAACNGFQTRDLLARFARAEAEGTGVVTDTPLVCFRQGLSSSFEAASARFEDWTHQDVTRAERSSVFRFMYRLAAERGRAFPTQFEMLLAAQAVVNANLSYEWLKDCRDFPGAPSGAAAAALPEIHLPLEAFTPDVATLSIERFDTLQRHRPKPRLRSASTPTRTRTGTAPVDESKYADNAWVHEDHPFSCSFPEEDVFMEEFAFALRDQAKESVRALEVHTRELTTSLEDGLDIRETLRNWHMGKIMVREETSLGKADIGAIVFDFAEPGTEDHYPWRAFWQAETHDASHLVFYATPFQDNVVGPGIARSDFGGFAVLPLSAVPFDPWRDPYVRALCRTPMEALLLASALATVEKAVLFLADRPPPAPLAGLIKRSGKTILYRSLGECPPDKIRRLRTFHILAEAGVRAYAQKYIRKEP